jgi:hypothetical protein
LGEGKKRKTLAAEHFFFYQGTGHGQIARSELLKLQKSGQIPDDPVKIKAHKFTM